VEQVNQGVALSKDQPDCHGVNRLKTMKRVLKVVATFHFAHKIWIFINCGFTAPRRTSTSVLTLLTSVVDTKTGSYMYRPNNWMMMVL
jgi:hypothetical protein